MKTPKPKYRGIIRLSFNKDAGSKFRNKVAPILEKANFVNTKTGLWESESENLVTVQKQLNLFMKELVKFDSDNPTFGLDHVWVYIDSLTLDASTRLV